MVECNQLIYHDGMVIISELHDLAESLNEMLAFEFGGEEGYFGL
jgi:hypothetical protein